MAVAPYDDDEIDNDDFLIRRINPKQHVVQDANTGRARLSSKLFSPSSEPQGGMSVDLKAMMIRDSVDIESFVEQPPFTAAVEFRAGEARAAGLIVGKDPIEDHDFPNPYHGEVWASGNRPNRFSRPQKRALQNACAWLVRLPDVDI